MRCGGGAGGDAGLASFFALGRGPARPLPDRETEPGALRVPIAVAQDEAFCFTYAESLDMLRRCGAQLLPFPLDDRALPEGACALYLPGGYPSCLPGRWRKKRWLAARWRQR